MENYKITCKNGEKLEHYLYKVNMNSKKFTTNMDYLSLDFSKIDGMSFYIGSDSILKVGDSCKIETLEGCDIIAGENCNITTGADCNIKTKDNCEIHTLSGGRLKTGKNCKIYYLQRYLITPESNSYFTVNKNLSVTYENPMIDIKERDYTKANALPNKNKTPYGWKFNIEVKNLTGGNLI